MLDSSALVVSASEAPAQPNVFGFEHDAHECTGTDTYTDAHTHAHAQSSNLKPEKKPSILAHLERLSKFTFKSDC